MEDNNMQALAKRRRPTVFAAMAMVLLAAAGVWLASITGVALVPTSGPAQDLVVNLLYYLPFIVLPLGLYMYTHRGLSDAMRLNPLPVGPTLSVILLGLLSVYAASALDTLWTLGLNALGLRAPEVQFDLDSSRALTFAIINAAAIPAVCEELLIRGFAMAAWESRGTKLAACVTAGLFTLLHSNLFGFPAYLLVGLVSAYLVFALDSIYAGIVYHTVYNAAILALNFIISRMNMPEPALDNALVMSMLVELALTAGMMAIALASLEFRRRALGIQPMPRTHAPLKPAEWALLSVAVLGMTATTIAVLAGVQV